MRIDKPRADRFRVRAEYLLELRHIDIHQSLPFFFRISGAESDIRVRDPRMLATPLDPGGLDLRLRKFTPSADLGMIIEFTFQQILVQWVDQRILLQ